MMQADFKSQIARLKVRFGERAFDPEMVGLIWREIHEMSLEALTRSVDIWLGSRNPNNPPMLAEFREAMLSEKKLSLGNETRAAFRRIENTTPLEEIFKEFGGARSAVEAMEKARSKNRRGEK